MKRKRPQASDPIELAARALRHRDRSRRQVEERLERAGVDEERRADALETLERVGYLDDARFAASRAGNLAGRGYGDDAIRQLLQGEGVAPALAAAAVAGLVPERERAARLVERLGASPRTAAQLQRKGFGEECVELAAGGSFADGEQGA
ncbi:MAG TPA: RecX family transcriptional regulator [Gaiellaceae bacterium]|nr:RecX family transcriptional regulator [Gaiellaceae bacterium]